MAMRPLVGPPVALRPPVESPVTLRIPIGPSVVVGEGRNGLADGAYDNGLHVLNLVGVSGLAVVLGRGGVVALALAATLGGRGGVGES